MNLQPLGDHVIVEPAESEAKTKSGIVLPDTAKEEPQEGKILAIGPGKMVDGKKVPLEVKKGDKVIYRKYGPDKVKIQSKEYFILSEGDILAVVK